MESSEEDDDFPTHEWITPQSHIHSVYQSDSEKGIRKLCSELLELKDSVENLCGNMHSKYSSFLRISEEVVEMEQELLELQKHVSTQGILVQDLMNGVCHELDEWNKTSGDAEDEDLEALNLEDILNDNMEDAKLAFLQRLDVLLAEHQVDEAIRALAEEEERHPELKESEESLPTDDSSYKVAFLERKAMLVDQLVEISRQPYVEFGELKGALSSLFKLGKGPRAHQLLLEAYSIRLRAKMEAVLPTCSIYSETYAATLSQLVFSTILMATKESYSMFGNSATYSNRITHWAECEIESFVQQVKENAPPSETALALRSVSVCLQAGLSHCSFLEFEGLKFSKLLMVLLHPYVEEVLDLNFERARIRVLNISGNDDGTILSPELCLPISAAATSNFMLTNSGQKFISIVMDILEQLTPKAILHFGGAVLNRLHTLFEKYVETLIRALPGPSEDDNQTEQNEESDFKVETDAQQLALLGTAFTVADELLPVAVSRIFTPQSDDMEPGANFKSESVDALVVTALEFKEWRRHLQHSVDKLRDHFCRQYVLTFIYSREGKARLDACMYLNGKGEDIFWESDPLPSLPFQALFARLKQLASVVGDVLGKEKIQKSLLARLIETVVIWLSDDQEFWDVFDDASIQLQPSGLQQLVLDMRFVVEIAVFGGYPSRNIQQIQQVVSTIITRAVRVFSKRGIDPQSSLAEDEWFVDAAKTAINKLLLERSAFEASEDDGDHIDLHLDDYDFEEETPLSPLSDDDSMDSFASAKMDSIDSPSYFTDPES